MRKQLSSRCARVDRARGRTRDPFDGMLDMAAASGEDRFGDLTDARGRPADLRARPACSSSMTCGQRSQTDLCPSRIRIGYGAHVSICILVPPLSHIWQIKDSVTQ
jgi:hypothetical protein